MSSSPGVIPRDKLKIWEIFRDVGPDGEEILKMAKLVHVSNKKKAYVVTTSDETYSFFRTRFVPSVCKISKIPQLCRIRVKEFVVALVDLAIAEDGSLYSWLVHDPDVYDPAVRDLADLAPNDFARLGRLEGAIAEWDKASRDLVVTPHRVLGSLSGKKVDQVALSFKRVMALTVCGEVHQWGEAATSWAPSLIPKKHFHYEEVISIACSDEMSVALTSSGELFQWERGNMVPKKVVVGNTAPFKKITAGRGFIFALTDNGDLYTARFQDSGAKKAKPVWTVAFGGQEFQDIETSGMVEIVIFELKNNIRFAIGYHGENSYPPISSFSQSSTPIEELFGEINQATCRTVWAQSLLKPGTMGDDIATLWGCKENSDVTFSVEGKTIWAHKCILSCRSEYFAKMFANVWNEAKVPLIEIKDTKFEIFESLLFYIYSDTVKFGEDEYENIFDLMLLADKNCDLKLRHDCEKILMRNITVENAFFLVRNASLANGLDLERSVVKFILNKRLLDLTSSPQELIDLLGMGPFHKISMAGLRRM